MLRLRLAFLGLASSLLVSLSGCCNMGDPCSGGSRLFNGSLMSRASRQPAVSYMESPNCECHSLSSHLPPGVEFPGTISGPQLIPPAFPPTPAPIPVTNMPVTQAPSMFKVPQALPMPYAPTQ